MAPALAVAFVAVSTGLSGFALGYRATLERGAADEAAQQVPLDALIGPSASFARPLQTAGLARWQTLSAGGRVLPARRTDASAVLNGNNVTLPALAVPAWGLLLIHGWRRGDGSASRATLADRLAPEGPVRTPGPQLPADARRLTVRLQAPDGEVQLSADLRNGGPYELEAFEIDEPIATQTLNGHQKRREPGGGDTVDEHRPAGAGIAPAVRC